MKIVQTSPLLTFTDEDRAAYAGLDIEYVVIDGSTQAALI